MGCIPEITDSTYPTQGRDAGRRCKVTFHYHPKPALFGRVVRNDISPPYITIIKLDDGRYLTTDECEYSTYGVPNFNPATISNPMQER